MRTIASTLRLHSPQVASFPSSSSFPTKWCRSSSRPFLGLGIFDVGTARWSETFRWWLLVLIGYGESVWYVGIYAMIFYYKYTEKIYCIYFYDKTYDGVYTNLYMAMAFSWCSSTQKNTFLMVVNDLEPYADDQRVLLTVGAAGWVQPRTFSACTVFEITRWSSLEIISSPPRASDVSNVTMDLGILYDWNHRNPNGICKGVFF